MPPNTAPTASASPIPPELPLCGLFAVGRERETSASYRWDGLKRDDGPLLLFQYTLAGEGAVEIGTRREDVGTGSAFLVEIPGGPSLLPACGQGGMGLLFSAVQTAPSPPRLGSDQVQARRRLRAAGRQRPDPQAAGDLRGSARGQDHGPVHRFRPCLSIRHGARPLRVRS
ncbi:hypothetical protein OMP38_10360 [Cohnella ginsengisoli]|uniref:AraC-type arabinose-binding/dimerisation domain-containing protein n=1 Tax=Cohnella ginsengisoli TaxID=425004 RepID=A0A9X4QMD9_9BACL|nr:hypothetical protein [Cohnella ginsengisoli]MDG0791226.1 hypothetical protein [Cohnella ginsengisoli]